MHPLVLNLVLLGRARGLCSTVSSCTTWARDLRSSIWSYSAWAREPPPSPAFRSAFHCWPPGWPPELLSLHRQPPGWPPNCSVFALLPTSRSALSLLPKPLSHALLSNRPPKQVEWQVLDSCALIWILVLLIFLQFHTLMGNYLCLEVIPAAPVHASEIKWFAQIMFFLMHHFWQKTNCVL